LVFFFKKGLLAAMKLALITRPEAQSAGLAARLAEKGYAPVLAPLFTVRRRTVSIPSGAQAALVTSANALASLLPGAAPLYAVGDATAEAARDRGFATVISAQADAARLADLVCAELMPSRGPLLLATGARQGGRLAADLRARGFRVLRRVCYEAVPVRRFPAAAAAALVSGDVAASVFLSAETAAIFVRLLPPECMASLGRVSALAIGQSTADALGVLPWLRICLARHPTLDEVLALL